MKILKIKISLYLLSIALGSCMYYSCVDDVKFGDGFLEKAPGVDVDIDTVFSKAEYSRYFLWNLYNHINCPFNGSNQLNSCPIESLSDIFHSHGNWSWCYEYYYPGIVTEDSQGGWIRDKFAFAGNNDRPGIWPAIRKGWILIENIDRVPDMSADEKSQLKGEAYIIMASRYLDAFKNFGGLPLVNHSYVAGEAYLEGRATTEGTVHFIDSLILCALDEPGLPWRVMDNENWAGRLTRGGALALRAKLYLFAASPLFNDDQPYMQYDKEAAGQNILHVWNGGRKQSYWDDCLRACEDFFRENQQNGNWYALVQPRTQDEAGYCQAFREAYWYRGNSEKIIEVHNSYVFSEWGNQNLGPGNVAHQGFLNPTLEFMEMFPMADGRNYPYKDIYGTNNPGNADIFAGRDPRLYETMLVTRERLRENYMGLDRVEIWKGGNVEYNTSLNGWPIRFSTGVALFKWVLDFWTMDRVPVSYSYMRMAEMHLIYAEALAETGNLLKACEEVNRVRSRVGLGRIETANPELQLTSNKENLIREIMRERAVEFGMEDQRLYDIIRRKEVDKFTSPLHELQTYRKTGDGERDLRSDTQLQPGEPWPDFIYDKVQITTGARRWWEPGFWTNKWFLSPLARAEINKGYGLTQNPGW
ncbi:MAG: RagB/SusD family nutrient uptake outer membrane protein [Tannerellaceae bacterium]|jgi:hypothetical protein|nr:RagB/SusD family nutrient uptake outer membrane protein [Tannerellaceae bacterium]